MFKAQGLETVLSKAAPHEHRGATVLSRQGSQTCPAGERWAPRWTILLSVSASLLLWAAIAALIF